MELSIILTYFGLLFTAYSATQELQRVKLKLIPSCLKFLFIFLSIVIFVTSFKEFKIYLLSFNDIYILSDYFKIYYPSFWQLKYFILLFVHIIIIVSSIMCFTKLRCLNKKKFLSLIKDLSKQANYKILNELINENVLKVVSLKSKKTFEKEYNELQNTLKTKQEFDFNESCIKKPILYILKIFSCDEKLIKNIENFINTEPNIKNNEFIDFRRLEILIKNKSFEDEFIEKYLKNLFQNQNSYIVKQVLDENSPNEYKTLLLGKNSFNLKLNNSIGLAIIKLLENDKNIQKELLEEYKGSNNTIYIATLIDLFPQNASYFTNTPNFIKKELLKYSKLDEDYITNGFYLLYNLLENVFEYIKNYYKHNKAILDNINSLYSLENIEICDSKKIKIISYYLEFLLDKNINEDEKFARLKNIIKDEIYLKKLFITAMTNTDRTIGKDYKEYRIYEKGNETRLKRWEKIKEILKDI